VSRSFPLARGFSVYSGFGPRDGGFHYGTDFGKDGGSGGLPVYACQGGAVANAGPASGFGQWVCLDHPDADGGGFTVYGHVLPEVSVGQRVEAGQRIARINPDSNTNGGVPPHCHLEVHRSVWSPPGPNRLDPLPWLGQAAYPAEQPPGGTVPTDPNAVLFGVDISNHQQNIDLDAIAREGFTAIIAKASEGSDYVDPFFGRNRDGANRNGLLFWGYHYLRAGDPVGNAQCWDQGVKGDRSIACMIDWEDGGGNLGDALAFKREVEALGYRVPMTYTGKWYWQRIGSPGGIDQLGALMDSCYGNNPGGFASGIYDGDGRNNWRSYGGADATLLQFTDHAQVAGRQVDAWAYRGTRDQLAALINGTPTANPNTQQEDDMTPDQASKLDRIHYELTNQFPNRVDGQSSDTNVGMVLNADANSWKNHLQLADHDARLSRIEDVLARIAGKVGA